MARPNKDPSSRKTSVVRVMLTPDQKGTLDRATQATDGDFSTWARPILLQAAERILAEKKGRPRKAIGLQ